MKIGTVTGIVAMRRQVAELEGQRVLRVELEGNELAALDKTQAQTGDRVLVVMSQAARGYSMEAPADAVAIAVVE